MHRTNTSTVRSVVNALEISLRYVFAWYDTFSAHIQTANQRSVPLQKTRTIQYF